MGPDEILTGSLLIVVAYLIGSIPSGLLAARVISGVDVRQHGSGNIGMVNVFRAAGPVAGVGTFVLDAFKGFLPVFIGTQFGFPNWLLLVIAGSAIFGHNWSIILRGKGGKGIATSVGTIGAFSPPVALICIGIWVAVLLMSRYASLASLLMIACIPILLVVFGFGWLYILFGIALLALAVYQHRPNIMRLRTGSELKIQRRSPAMRHGK